MALPIEDYALVGDTSTAALIGRDGSVDWLCLPRFDSPACFASLLGDEDNGHWRLGPEGRYTSTRRYVDTSAALETTFTTDTGTVRVIDVMPEGDGRADLVRRVVGVSGTVTMEHAWVVRAFYGKVKPWVTHQVLHDTDVIVAVAGPDKLVLRGSRLPRPVGDRHVDRFEVAAGQELTFATTWVPSHREVPEFLDFDARIEATIARTRRWAARCTYQGPYRDAVVRSLVTLRLMTHGATGGIVAAPTTSLPEHFGGVRNWDYRYCWLRDASLTLEALLACGYSVEARLWRDWLLRAVAGDPGDLQIMYAVDGARDLPERELEHLAGYAGSVPVRIGNGAVGQKQTDVLGEVMVALEMARDLCVPETADTWSLQRALVEDLADHWDEPDHGLWEIRGPMRHFTHSRVMVWVAFDRAIRAAEDHGHPAPLERWRKLRADVREEVLARGFDKGRNTFTQHYDTTEVDASLLVLPLVGFLDGDDPRMLGTLEAIEHDLMEGGLLLRYRTESGVDGLPGDEHPFVACSFWLVSAYAKGGRPDDAHRLMRRLLGLLNDVGLVAEEYDPVTGRMAGNFPQAFSHLALVGAAVNLAEADARVDAPETVVEGLLLAAGGGTRMGMPKALLRDGDGSAWVRQAASTLHDGGCPAVTVVLGARAPEATEALEDLPGTRVVVAEDWADGMGSSLRAGLADLATRDTDCAVVSLVDLPDVSAGVVARLLERAGGAPGVLARATYGGRRGHPVLLGRDHWAGVLATTHGDRGARDYLEAHRVVLVECGDLATGRDVDTPDRVPPATPGRPAPGPPG